MQLLSFFYKQFVNKTRRRELNEYLIRSILALTRKMLKGDHIDSGVLNIIYKNTIQYLSRKNL